MNTHRAKQKYCNIKCSIEYSKDMRRRYSKTAWENYGTWHLDHIIPISSGKTEEQIVKLNHYSNFQPLWALDNMRKHTKII